MMRQKKLLILVFSAFLLVLFLNKKIAPANSQIFKQISIDFFHSLSDKQQFNYLKDLSKNTNVENARTFLKSAYPNEPSDKHELIHAVGEAAYLQFGYSGLAKCDSTFMYGCYHGVVLEAIRQNGYSDKVLKDLAQGCLNLSSTNKTLTTACSHGIGHAIMVVRSYDLLESYKDCDRTFSQDKELFYCWDGVSMENIVRRFEQTGAKKFLKAEDPYYPCNAVPEKYQVACAREHVFYVFDLINYRDIQKAIAYCFSFSNEKVRFECTSAIGNFLNQDYGDNPDKIIDECNKLGGKYIAFCIIRAATQYSFSRQVDRGKILCDSLNIGADRNNCLESVKFAKEAL